MNASDVEYNIRGFREDIASIQARVFDGQKRFRAILTELVDLQLLRRSLMLEITHIKKILFADEALSLFSAHTCPLCLNEVETQQGYCVCGAALEPEQGGALFYSSSEYLQLLRSKQRNLKTVDSAIQGAESERDQTESEVNKGAGALKEAEDQLSEHLKVVGTRYDITRLKRLEDRILRTRTRLEVLDQQIKLERRRQELEEARKLASQKVEDLKRIVRSNRDQSVQEMRSVVNEFSKKYEQLIKKVLPQCRTARIDDNYEPIINEGEYKEASSGVTVRLLYYWTLLYVSLRSNTIPFPRFLIVDTPETAGIDKDNLLKAIEQLEEATSGCQEDDYQVILTTGVSKYPAEYQSKVVLRLSKDKRLLKEKS